MYKIMKSAEQSIHRWLAAATLNGLCCETRGDVRERSERVRGGL